MIEQASFDVVSVISDVNLDKALSFTTGLATALAAQAAKQQDIHQEWTRSVVAAVNKWTRVLVSSPKLHTLHACLVPCRLTSATMHERLYDCNVQ